MKARNQATLLGALGCALCSAPVHAVVCYSDALPTAPDTAFAVNGDGTVLDYRTGLTWSVCSEGQVWSNGGCSGIAGEFDWEAALELPSIRNAVGHLGHDDWRLPNKVELASIVEFACVRPAINFTIFPDTPEAVYWTSTPYLLDTTQAWRVVFNYGNLTLGPRTDAYAVRLVRD